VVLGGVFLNIYLIYDEVSYSDICKAYKVFYPIACFLVEKTARECLELIHEAANELKSRQGNSAITVLRELYNISVASSTATMVEIEVLDVVDDNLRENPVPIQE
jgi:hypothetical protein